MVSQRSTTTIIEREVRLPRLYTGFRLWYWLQISSKTFLSQSFCKSFLNLPLRMRYSRLRTYASSKKASYLKFWYRWESLVIPRWKKHLLSAGIVDNQNHLRKHHKRLRANGKRHYRRKSIGAKSFSRKFSRKFRFRAPPLICFQRQIASEN